MRRKTQARAHKFSHEGENFRATKFGFLEGNELLLKYMPTLLKIFKQIKSEKSEEGIKADLEKKEMNLDLGAIIKELGQQTFTKLSHDLFSQTELEVEEGHWELIDPEMFDDYKEMFAVASEVFTFNYPDFFKGDKDTEEPKVSQNMTTAPSKINQKTSSKPEILKL